MLGYFGYPFFGLLVWAYWLTVAHLIELDPDFAHKDVHAALDVEGEGRPRAA